VISRSSRKTERISRSSASSCGPSPRRRDDAARGDGPLLALLELEQDQQRTVAGIGRRPLAHLRQAGDEADAGRLLIEVGDVEDLDPGSRQAGSASGPAPTALRTSGQR